MVKRNDKVMVMEPYVSRPKLTLTIKVFPGELLIVKRVHPGDDFYEVDCCICERKGESPERWLPIDADCLFKYTRIGVLLYG